MGKELILDKSKESTIFEQCLRSNWVSYSVSVIVSQYHLPLLFTIQCLKYYQ